MPTFLSVNMRAITHGTAADILQSHVNVVVSHKRAQTPAGLEFALRSLPEWSRSVTAQRAELPAAAAALLEPLRSLELRAALQGQVVDIAREYCQVLGYEQVDVTLEVVKGVTCPKFHSDVVEVRCLCTFWGPGTLWVEDAHVDRSRLRTLPKEDVVGWSAISHPSAVHQAAAGEVLYLKGSRFPGAEGSGAVHRSPDTGGGAAPRLLLKLDAPSAAPAAARRACGAGCSHVHTH